MEIVYKTKDGKEFSDKDKAEKLETFMTGFFIRIGTAKEGKDGTMLSPGKPRLTGLEVS